MLDMEFFKFKKLELSVFYNKFSLWAKVEIFSCVIGFYIVEFAAAFIEFVLKLRTDSLANFAILLPTTRHWVLCKNTSMACFWFTLLSN